MNTKLILPIILISLIFLSIILAIYPLFQIVQESNSNPTDTHVTLIKNLLISSFTLLIVLLLGQITIVSVGVKVNNKPKILNSLIISMIVLYIIVFSILLFTFGEFYTIKDTFNLSTSTYLLASSTILMVLAMLGNILLINNYASYR